MAMNISLTTANTVVTVNGRQINDWASDSPAIQEEPIDPKRILVRGLGGNAVMLDRANPGHRVTLAVNPGGADSAYLHGLYTTGSVITYTRTQVGSLENVVATEGVIIQENAVGRVVTDNMGGDTYTIEFNVWESLRGGEN